MLFTNVARLYRRGLEGRDQAFLIDDGWDDYSYRTLFELVVFDADGKRIDVGPVKIMRRGMGYGRVPLPAQEFDALDENYCSLGQEQNYYELIAQLPPSLKAPILNGLRDCVFDLSIFNSFVEERPMTVSLMRSLNPRTVRETFVGALTGQVPLTSFRFSYQFPRVDEDHEKRLTFAVYPHSLPPTNIHALIGRNGVGKTWMLWDMTAVLCRPRGHPQSPDAGTVKFDTDCSEEERFSRLITVAFSAFDPFRAPREGANKLGDLSYSYIGLKSRSERKESEVDVSEQSESIFIESQETAPDQVITKTEDDLLLEFVSSLENCINPPRLQRWYDSLKLLGSDPGFRDLELDHLINDDSNFRLAHAQSLFSNLSSGHKIVLLTVTRLVELVDERTLVLIDEPESHLHPPLLSSLIRVLSMLLNLRNGVAIVATHSPVVLQEMPKSCVWMLRRSGDALVVERPSIENFGENVGVLTREVFGLEVTHSGFHKMIADSIDDAEGNYAELNERFGGQLGSEARAIALALSRFRQ